MTTANNNRSLLNHYLDEIATVDLMTPEEEVSRATEIGELKRNNWVALLSFPPVVHAIAEAAEAMLGDDDEHVVKPELRKVRSAANAVMKDKSAAKERRYVRAAKACAEVLARHDVDGTAADSIWADLEALRSVYDRGARLRLDLERIDRRGFKTFMRRAARAGHAWRYARNAFARANLRLVVKIAHRYNNGQLPLEDLVQEGNIGLMTAVERFDPTKGFRFSTYSGWWIRHAITRAIAKRGRTVRLPVYMKTTHTRAMKERRALQGELGREPTLAELADRMQMDLKRLERIEEAMRTRSVSLYDSSDEEGYPLEEIVADERCESPSKKLDSEVIGQSLNKAITILEPMELDILRKRFGLDESDERTLREVGDDYGLSRERIRQLQKRALDKLRGKLESDGVHAC